MTTALWIANVIVGVLVIADMLYGKHMAKKWMSGCCSMDAGEDIDMDYCELEMRDEELEKRICVLEEKCNKPKRTSKKTSTRKRK